LSIPFAGFIREIFEIAVIISDKRSFFESVFVL
jgi:hypothetical protein